MKRRMEIDLQDARRAVLMSVTASFVAFTMLPCPVRAEDATEVPALPAKAELALEEDWSSGAIDDQTWYRPRKKWGGGNHGVVPENVFITTDNVSGSIQNVLECRAHGDRYQGDIVGLWGKPQRVGGVLVSQRYFASGRFEVVLKIGAKEKHAGGPIDPMRPKGAIPAVWTFAYRFVEGDNTKQEDFVASAPLYNPHMPAYGIAANEYWSELDFPEFGKAGKFDSAMYNTFLQKQHDNRFFDVSQAIDGDYHTYTTQWRTQLTPLPDIRDDQVVEAEGYWWVKDKAIPFDKYYGNPLLRRGQDDYLLYEGKIAEHWIDGEKVGENTRWVPAMAAQLTMGVWLPDWAGPADWETASMRIASVKVWQFADEGDICHVLKGNLDNNFRKDGQPIE